jgi:hypothetical protein
MAWYDDILGSGVNIFGAAPPSYLGGEGGLLNTAEMDKLKQKSLISGLLNTGLTYLAQPKNQRYGSALPYLAKAGIAGVGASQNVYDQASQDYMTKAKIEELQAGKTYATQLLNDPRVKGKPELEMLARKDPAKLFEFLNPKKEYKQAGNEVIAIEPYSGTATSVYTGKPTTNSPEVANLHAYMDTLPENDPRRASVQKIIDELPKKGSTNINNYPAGTLPVGKTGQGKLDEVLLDSGTRLMQLNQIDRMYKPEYQTYAYQGENAWNALKEKGGLNLDPKDQEKLQSYTAYKQTSVKQLNDYIRSVTGATITESEAGRLMAAIPNVGEGTFGGDSPTQFKTKLDNTIRELKYAEARAAYIKKKGFTLNDSNVTLSDVPMLMKNREQELITNNKLDLSKEGDRNTLKRQLAAEFGLMQFSK